MPTAILFPGQGRQTPEMRDHVAQARPDLLDLAFSVLGEDPFLRVDDGTAYAQPAIFCASLAGWAALGRPRGDYVAGHSLGELGAARRGRVPVASMTGCALVALRGRLMQDAGERAGDGGMVALLGRGAAERAEELAAAHGLAVANDNSPQQVVLSGAALGCCRPPPQAAQEQGLRAMILPVTGAFHSPMMAERRRAVRGRARRSRGARPGRGHDRRLGGHGRAVRGRSRAARRGAHHARCAGARRCCRAARPRRRPVRRGRTRAACSPGSPSAR